MIITIIFGGHWWSKMCKFNVSGNCMLCTMHVFYMRFNVIVTGFCTCTVHYDKNINIMAIGQTAVLTQPTVDYSTDALYWGNCCKELGPYGCVCYRLLFALTHHTHFHPCKTPIHWVNSGTTWPARVYLCNLIACLAESYIGGFQPAQLTDSHPCQWAGRWLCIVLCWVSGSINISCASCLFSQETVPRETGIQP